MIPLARRILNRFLARPSGRRFIYAYIAVNKVVNQNIFIKFFLSLIGFVFLMIGFIMLFTPGPGVLFIFLGGIFLCAISKKIAHFFDHLEIHGKKLKDKYWKS